MNCLRLLQRVHQQNIISVSAARHISHMPFKFKETENKWKENDQISKEYNLVYKGPMDKMLNYLTTYLTSSTMIMTAGSIYYATSVFDVKQIDTPIVIGDVVIANNAYECFVYLGAFVAFHIAIKILLAKYVVRLYQYEDQYIAVFRGHIHNQIKKHEFNRKEVKKLKTKLVLTWPDARFSLGKKHAILLDHYFKTPEHFNFLTNANAKSDPNRE